MHEQRSSDVLKQEKLMEIFHLPLLCLAVVVGLSFFFEFSSAADTITSSQTLNDTQTLVSDGGTFEMGFFSPGTSGNRYVGIWYHNIPVKTVIWVANRAMPVNDSSGSGVLMLNQTSGNLEILTKNMSTSIWSSNSSRKLDNPVVQLLDTGNLVLRDENDGDNYAWESFDHPSNTFIAGMKIGWDSKSGINRQYTSWKSLDDPSPGSMMIQMDLTPNPELVLWKGGEKLTRSGPWVGTSFSNIPEQKSNQIYDFEFVSDEDEIYYMYSLKNESVIIITVLNESTSTRDRYVWIDAQKTWQLYSSVPGDNCDYYEKCGANGICSINNFPICSCMEGFTPKSPSEWELSDWSAGCVQSEPINCSLDHDFLKFSNVKLPDTTNSWLNQSMNLEECKLKCLSNCSCMAYTNSDVRNGGTGCAIWFGDLNDIKKLQEDGQDLYVRVVSSDSGKKSKIKILAAVVAASAVCFLVILIAAYCIYWKKNSRGLTCFIYLKEQIRRDRTEHKMEDMELPVFSLVKVAKATNGFSFANKLGEGGFGSVYKGTLEDGQQIAVKRLSISSGQGEVEFKNEVRLIAKLQHRNLVRLLGCCLEGIEKMLVYEYMPNGSLDYFIFDQTRSKLLNWPTRLNIISGIARGLLYLHQDSRLRIIHRDLKASNVLLDDDMNPKISDFGMAKTFGGDQTEGNTNRVVGTYGYMAPEYAIDGLFSIKSDVYSFGVLMLEIVSGKRNRGFAHTDALHLLEYAYTMWTGGTPLQLVDESVGETWSVEQVIRCIHVGLLCVQQHPEDRPSMPSVILMLGSENELPEPQQPAFFKFGPDKAGKSDQVSSNDVTMTLLGAR